MIPPATIASLGWIPEDLMAPEDAAWFLGLEPAELRRWRRQGTGPAYERWGWQAFRYKAGDLERWRGQRPRPKRVYDAAFPGLSPQRVGMAVSALLRDHAVALRFSREVL